MVVAEEAAVGSAQMVVQVVAAEGLAVLVFLGATATILVVLVGVQPFKAQLSETALEVVAVQAEVTVTVVAPTPKLATWRNLEEVEAVRLME